MSGPRADPTPDDLLDDEVALALADPAEMLRAVATSAAQVREAASFAAEAGVEALAADGRPRAVVTLGMGGSGIAGDVLAAVAGHTSPVPVIPHKGYGLPGWVGPADLVAAVSCSGTTEETLSAAEEAVRRGARMLAVGAAGSPLEALAAEGRAPFVPVTQGRQPRATMWALSVPLLVAGYALGITPAAAPAAVEAAATRLEEIGTRCRAGSDAFVNPAKTLALELAGTVPMIWGTTPVTGVAASRAQCQLAENAKYPAICGVLPEANHNQVVAFDGPFGVGTTRDDDIFRDRTEEPDPVRLRLVLLRDRPDTEHPQVTRRAQVSRDLARGRGIPVTELEAAGAGPLERLASLVGLIDYATVYLGIALGLDPTPVTAIQELKRRIAD